MNIRVFPSQLSGQVAAPPSKSVMQRLVAGALLAEGTSHLYNISQSDDCTSALLLASQLGAEIELGETDVRITGTGGNIIPRSAQLTPGESGLAARLFTPIAGLGSMKVSMQAEDSLRGRPMQEFESVFRQLGGCLKTTGGSFPVSIERPLQGGTTMLNGQISSQFTTGLLFALPCANLHSELNVHKPVSTPYIDLTLQVLADFGVEIHANEERAHFSCDGHQTFRPIETVVDGDWSGAAALAVAGMLCAESSIEISGLNNQYRQADEAIRGAMLFAGGALSGTDEGIQVAKRPVRAFNVDLTDSPDLFPVLAALAAFGKKPSKLKGMHRLEHKESNRAAAIQTEWKKLGIRVEIDRAGDELIVFPRDQNFVPTEPIDSHGDHRIAMAASIVGLAGEHPIIVSHAECVSKSYPEFFDDLEIMGASFRIQSESK